MLCLKIAGCVANSVDPDEMPHSAASQLGLLCLLSLSVQIQEINMVFRRQLFAVYDPKHCCGYTRKFPLQDNSCV